MWTYTLFYKQLEHMQIFVSLVFLDPTPVLFCLENPMDGANSPWILRDGKLTLSLFLYIYVCVYIDIDIDICISISIYLYVCMYVCVCVWGKAGVETWESWCLVWVPSPENQGPYTVILSQEPERTRVCLDYSDLIRLDYAHSHLLYSRAQLTCQPFLYMLTVNR